jgi:hypothetical protein
MLLAVVAIGVCLVVAPVTAATVIDTWGEVGSPADEGWEVETYTGVPPGSDPSTEPGDIDGDSNPDFELNEETGNRMDKIYTDRGDTESELLDEVVDGGGDNNLNAYDFGSAGGGDPMVDAVAFITFDFYSDANDGDDYPANLYFYFLTDPGASETIWRINIFDQLDTPGDWNDITISLWNPTGAGWSNPLGDDTFANTFNNVYEMGVMIQYAGGAGQNYGIDNYAMHNPEPGTYAVLAFALVSLGVTFRGKLRTGIKGLLRK